jgi:hypothetical protein
MKGSTLRLNPDAPDRGPGLETGDAMELRWSIVANPHRMVEALVRNRIHQHSASHFDPDEG